MADYHCCIGSFTRPNTTGAQVVTGIADAFGSFTPSCIIFFTTQQATDGLATDAHITIYTWTNILFQGWSSSKINNTIGIGGCAVSAMGTAWRFSSYWDSLSQVNNWVSALTPSDGQFSITWAGVDASHPCDIHYIAFGGADFLAKIGRPVRTTVGVQAVTGLGFPPSAVLASAVATVRGLNTYVGGVAVDNLPNLGVMTETFQGATAEGFISTNMRRTQRTDLAVRMYNPVNDGYRSAAERESLDADGFSWNWLQASSPPQNAYGDPGTYYTAFGGALPVVATSTTQPASPQTVSIPLGGRPGVVLFFSWGLPAASSGDATGNNFSFGAVDDVGHQISTWMGGRIYSNGFNIAARQLARTRTITLATPVFANPSSPPTVTSDGAATATITDAGVDVDWTTVDGTARELIVVAFGATGTPPPPPPPPLTCDVGHGSCTPNVAGSRTGM